MLISDLVKRITAMIRGWPSLVPRLISSVEPGYEARGGLDVVSAGPW